jgi:pimeloyl-ACP methyl ester carboxylesterase
LFVLVHGVCAGGWAWDLVTPHLESAGHATLPVDLPGDDPTARFSDYAEVILGVVPEDADNVVLVGHSTGGLTIPLVAAIRPVTEMVFVCGAIPVPGQSVAERGIEWRVIEPSEWQVDNGDGSFSVSEEGFRRHVCPDAPPEAIEESIRQLRPQSYAPFLEPCPIERMPEVPTRVILCRDDEIVSPDYSRRTAREMLGVQAHELPGSHSPMASRPEALAHALLGTTTPAAWRAASAG